MPRFQESLEESYSIYVKKVLSCADSAVPTMVYHKLEFRCILFIYFIH